MTTEIAKRETRITITKEYATYLLKTIWPGAPDDAIIKAALICAHYGLDPLLKEVAILKFDRYAGRGADRHKVGEEWVVVRDIKAKRKMAAKRIKPHRYSYVDDTPRVMTEDEQKRILGAVDPDRIWAITKLKIGNDVYPGYGNWSKNDVAYGSEKGNSQRNMAFIRSEANALDKMAPGDQDESIEVFDSTYVPLRVDKETLEKGKEHLQLLAEQDKADVYGDEDIPGLIQAQQPTLEGLVEVRDAAIKRVEGAGK